MDDARLFLCARCQCQVRICTRCDRGQQYCGASCSAACRAESLRAAGRRYQRSRRGRHCHAERQQRYRERCRESALTQEVTHHGSASPCAGASLSRHTPLMRETHMSMPLAPSTTPRCSYCARPISDFVRLGWRRSRLRRGIVAPVRR